MEPRIIGPVIIASKADPASINIAENLIKHYPFSKYEQSQSEAPIYTYDNISLVRIDELGIHAKPETAPKEATTLVFASKHVSSSGKPALTVHATGNPTSEALYDGFPDQLSFVDPRRVKTALRALRAESAKQGLEIEVTMEATHHGPTSFEVPVMFVEIGSGPQEWSDPALGEIAAKVIMKAAERPQSSPNTVGFGGTHYSTKHTRMCLEEDLAIGHILSRHSFDGGASDVTIKQAFDKTINGCKTALVDWKGLNGRQRQHLLFLLEQWNITVERC